MPYDFPHLAVSRSETASGAFSSAAKWTHDSSKTLLKVQYTRSWRFALASGAP